MEKNYFTCKKNLTKILIKSNLNESVFCELAQAKCILPHNKTIRNPLHKVKSNM